MSRILQLFGDDIQTILAVLAFFGIVIEVSPIKINPITYLLNKINAPIKNELNALKSDVEDLKGEIKTKIDKQSERIDEIRMQELRKDILNFSNALSRGTLFPRESYTDIFDAHTEYENLITQYDFKNGRVDFAMNNIRKKYNECSQNQCFDKLDSGFIKPVLDNEAIKNETIIKPKRKYKKKNPH